MLLSGVTSNGHRGFFADGRALKLCQFAALVEAKIGTEEQGPEEKLWSKEKKLANVRSPSPSLLKHPGPRLA